MYKGTKYYKEKFYTYPAVLDDSENEKGTYTVTFPDVPGAIGEGKGISEAIASGKEGLESILIASNELYTNSPIEKVKKDNPNKIVTYILADMEEAREITKPATVKKNTTIPRDLAIKGEKAGVNFSKLLTDALRVKLS
ncbi:HicB_like antitoxin of toxin-antitoxin system [Lactobacillus bombicola]|uniref:HicB_like antitoxin of toxin-antitoxin system n=2 Tax=Lactobacillus bombicola TaxID=1505723 RepID=A0A1I1RG89_9LACO|nr:MULTISPECIES: type II toxin-antitoxin system HicB family antitoxin [Lactobacillus]RMC41570.1 HicB family protein [Lactobacillus sp. ESL0233]SFD31178.1 HicB_like antitoxin of toxin-antitoxin system [Lactobacillus bombicola]